jgi:DNA-binding CsgD family transcriptional regulator
LYDYSSALHPAEPAVVLRPDRTPALASTGSLVPLSAREREIASFAAQGETATEVAARLFLSKRTVNNHLQNV